MTSKNTAPDRPTVAVGETNLFSVDFSGILDSGESLSGTPTVVEVTTSDLTIASESVSSSALTINGKSVTAGQAVQFKVSGQAIANSPYTIKITCGTDSTPVQTKVKFVQFDCEGV